MANSPIVESDYLLSDRALSVQNKFNAHSKLHLYHSLIVPSPSTPLGTFQLAECTFDTYAPIDTALQWQNTFRVQPGQWRLPMLPVTWASPVTHGDTIFGAWLDDGGTNLYWAILFANPVPFAPGSVPFSVQVDWDLWALSIVP